MTKTNKPKLIEKINDRIISYYDHRWTFFSNSWSSVAKKRLTSLENKLIEREIQKIYRVTNKKRIKTLDIGIAYGRLTEFILKFDVDHYAIDISKTMIELSLKRFKKSRKVREFKVHDIFDPLPKVWGKFDFILVSRVLPYTPYWKKALKILHSYLNKNGVLVFTFPNKYSSIVLAKLYSLLDRSEPSSDKGYETTFSELTKAIQLAGYSSHSLEGLSRMLDLMYVLCDSKRSADMLFLLERLLTRTLGKTLFTRDFYAICKK